MKKLSSILVLMLIALMLFVSCNNSTPTKEEPAKEEPAKLEERDAIYEDVDLTMMLYSAMGVIENESYTSNNLKKEGNTYNFINNGCELTVTNQSTSDEVKVILVGSVTKTPVDDKTDKYDCDLKEGTVIAGTSYTVKASLNIDDTSFPPSITVHEAIINGKKVNKLTEKLAEYFKSMVPPSQNL